MRSYLLLACCYLAVSAAVVDGRKILSGSGSDGVVPPVASMQKPKNAVPGAPTHTVVVTNVVPSQIRPLPPIPALPPVPALPPIPPLPPMMPMTVMTMRPLVGTVVLGEGTAQGATMGSRGSRPPKTMGPRLVTQAPTRSGPVPTAPARSAPAPAAPAPAAPAPAAPAPAAPAPAAPAPAAPAPAAPAPVAPAPAPGPVQASSTATSQATDTGGSRPVETAVTASASNVGDNVVNVRSNGNGIRARTNGPGSIGAGVSGGGGTAAATASNGGGPVVGPTGPKAKKNN